MGSNTTVNTASKQTSSWYSQEIVTQKPHVVTTAGRPSGIAATARATATYQKKRNREYIL